MSFFFRELVNKAGYPLPSTRGGSWTGQWQTEGFITLPGKDEFHWLIISKSSSQKQDSNILYYGQNQHLWGTTPRITRNTG